MRRTITLSIVFLLGVLLHVCVAQELKVKSFQVSEGDLIARTSPRNDLNGKPCAVIRVGIALQHVQFAGNVMGDPIAEPGEYLVYMPQGNTELTIRHNNYLPLIVNFFDYGIGRLQSGCTYRLTILKGDHDSSEPQIQGNFLVLNITPKQSRISVDGGQQESANAEGVFKTFLTLGSHTYRVESEGYDIYTESILMSGERITKSVSLRSLQASLSVNCPTSGAGIYVNEEYKGTTRWQGVLNPGTYLLEARMEGYRLSKQTVTLGKQEVRNISFPTLQPIYGSLMVDYEPVDAAVYVDGKLLGKSPNLFTKVLVGSHELKVVKEGYAAHTERVTISENQQSSVSGKLERSGGNGSLSSHSSGGPVSINGYDYVDLGLSVKWATKNVGADSPSDYGDYFAWGETEPKSSYYWATCFDCLDDKGNSWGTYKKGGKTSISPDSGHDTARANLGGSWRMPTDAEFDELCKKCTWTWTSQGGHSGYKVTGPNGKSIFLPAAGLRDGSNRYDVGGYGLYWSSTLSSSYSNYARSLYFISSSHGTSNSRRSCGRSVRPVTD